MPLDPYSTLRFASVISDVDGVEFSTEPEPFLYEELEDTIEHKVSAGDTWWTIAYRYYVRYPNPSRLWRVIADFQPGGPVVDPTIALEPASIVYVPSPRTLDARIFTDRRRPDLGG